MDTKKGKTLLAVNIQPVAYGNFTTVILDRSIPYFFIDQEGFGNLSSTNACIEPLIEEIEARIEFYNVFNGKKKDLKKTVMLQVSITPGLSFWPNASDIFGPVLNQREMSKFMRGMKKNILAIENGLAEFFGGVISFVDLYVSLGTTNPVIKLLVMPVDETGGLNLEKYLTDTMKSKLFKACEHIFLELSGK